MAAALAVSVGILLAATSRIGSTFALLSDYASVEATATVGEWAPDPPSACGDLRRYGTPPHRKDAVVWGTMADDILILDKSVHPQVVMGLDGDDVIVGGNSGDCLVGGAGNDRIFGGNAKDILLGGPGDDFLDGGNSKDVLDGEDDADECVGGNGKDDVINCDADEEPLQAPPSVLDVQESPPGDESDGGGEPVPGPATGDPPTTQPSAPEEPPAPEPPGDQPTPDQPNEEPPPADPPVVEPQEPPTGNSDGGTTTDCVSNSECQEQP